MNLRQLKEMVTEVPAAYDELPVFFRYMTKLDGDYTGLVDVPVAGCLVMPSGDEFLLAEHKALDFSQNVAKSEPKDDVDDEPRHCEWPVGNWSDPDIPDQEDDKTSIR